MSSSSMEHDKSDCSKPEKGSFTKKPTPEEEALALQVKPCGNCDRQVGGDDHHPLCFKCRGPKHSECEDCVSMGPFSKNKWKIFVQEYVSLKSKPDTVVPSVSGPMDQEQFNALMRGFLAMQGTSSDTFAVSTPRPQLTPFTPPVDATASPSVAQSAPTLMSTPAAPTGACAGSYRVVSTETLNPNAQLQSPFARLPATGGTPLAVTPVRSLKRKAPEATVSRPKIPRLTPHGSGSSGTQAPPVSDPEITVYGLGW